MVNPVYFYVPNIIGTGRIILGAAAFYYLFEGETALFFALYAVSELLDAVDGHAARYFNQSTNYGAVLDMVTDRASTTVLGVALAQKFPTYSLAIMASIALDIMSHYAHLYATLANGGGSHKDVDENTNIFIRLYYGNKLVLFTLCLANEAMFLLPFLLADPQALPFVPEDTLMLAFKAALFLGGLKQFMNLVQFCKAMQSLADADFAKSSSVGNGYRPKDKIAQERMNKKVALAESQGMNSPARRTRSRLSDL
eukprot:TRINITY_DN5792_c0_g1_i1.p1 TRINITY_DN5792_c0_g1~~TRINITY_DN5792_c0_g1_i1.p1  ORF type:complete len:275 (-),score=77.25 TRINITY_DN5792_c0_g1_i1:163-924(-)